MVLKEATKRPATSGLSGAKGPFLTMPPAEMEGSLGSIGSHSAADIMLPSHLNAQACTRHFTMHGMKALESKAAVGWPQILGVGLITEHRARS